MSNDDQSRNSPYENARLYDILHRPGTASELKFLEKTNQWFGLGYRSSHWLEPACGTGRLARLAATHGWRVAGFDLEPRMVAYAREHTPAPLKAKTRFFEARMESFHQALPARGPWSRFGFAFNLINTIRHLPSDRAMLDHFAAIARVLKPGGIYAVGISLSLYGIEQETEDVWEGTRGTCKVSQVVQYIPPAGAEVGNTGGTRKELVISHLTVTRPRGEEHLDSSYTLRTYNLAQWTKLIARSALQTLTVLGDDGKEIPPPKLGYAIWVLTPRKVSTRTRVSQVLN